MNIFESKFKHPTLVMKTDKRTKDGEVMQEPIHIHFENHIFKTEDESIAEFIRGLPNFAIGADYWEIDALPAEPKKSGLDFGVEKMPSDANQEIGQKVGALETQINKIAELVLDLSKKLSDKEDKPEDDTKPKEDVEEGLDANSEASTADESEPTKEKTEDIKTEDK